MTRKSVSTLGDLSSAQKLALLEMLYEQAKVQLATGYDTTGRPICQRDFEITNNARKLIKETKRQAK
ncbi:hypothetical protein [Paraburkholderia sp. MM5477-R1]|uniref:hypothetical protein n=1 Tax=Paraburkholderia sp. MM5477-R1 TaxID=2991062 RepID=UPI003D21BF79